MSMFSLDTLFLGDHVKIKKRKFRICAPLEIWIDNFMVVWAVMVDVLAS
jgi:hypothetical protein